MFVSNFSVSTYILKLKLENKIKIKLFLSFVSEIVKKRLKRSDIFSNHLTNANKLLDDENDEKHLHQKSELLNENDKRKLNEKAVLINLTMQKEKVDFEDTIEEEYIEKVIMFGYIVVKNFLYC